MNPTVFKRSDIRKQIDKSKNKKASGPDGVKNEIYKAMAKSDICMNVLEKTFNNELTIQQKPQSWKNSVTTMIPKMKRPTVVQLRPIALTDASYKIFMGMTKEKVEIHLENNNLDNDLQMGFTSKRRLQDNLFILNECKEAAYKNKKKLYVIAIDYCKAYDSVKREKIIEALIEYKIDYRIIDNIAEIYQNDQTIVKIREDLQIEFGITNGIRQGCNLSPTLFKILTYKIMECLEKKCAGFNLGSMKINSIFYADDSLILAENRNDAEKSIECLRKESEKYGLRINDSKSNIIIFNDKDEIKETEISGIKVEQKIKYLGVLIDGKRNMFDSQKKEMINKAKKMENMTYGIIERSCNRVMIGKTYWKDVVLPSILHAVEIIDLTKEEIKKLQIIENNIYRKILGAPSYTPIVTLRGEIGSSEMLTRVIKTKLLYWKSIFERKNELLKEIAQQPECKMVKKVINYAEQIGVTREEIRMESEKWLKGKIRDYDNMRWKEEIESKTSLSIYRQYRDVIKEQFYFNNKADMLLFRLRTNTLNLNDCNRFTGEDIRCVMCGGEKEDIVHFVVKCCKLQDYRNKIVKLQLPQEENSLELVGEVLFGEVYYQRELLEMWVARRDRVGQASNQILR